jgi:hypothetical protein
MRILLQSLHNQSTDLSGDWPHHIYRQARSVVCDNHSIAISALVQAFDSDDPATAPPKSMFERIGEELIDDKPDWQGDVYRNRGMLDF